MATILLNGIETPLAEILGDPVLADKITVRGGVQSVEAQGLGGDELFEVEANNEAVDVTLKGDDGEDVIVITAGNPDELEWVGTAAINGAYIGGNDNDSIEIGDGLAVLQGTAKGGQGDDTITIARADGAFINGNAGVDDISLGFADGYGTAAGSRATASILDSTIYGGADDDTITVDGETEINDSVVKGQKDDDTITVIEGATGSGNFFGGNKGDDELNIAKLVGENNKVRGGRGNDTIRGGNGQDVYGDDGGDLFSVEAEGGMHIKDYGRKFSAEGDKYYYGEDGYDCDDQIQIDGHKIFYTTNEYCIDTDIYSSASSFRGNIVVSGYVNQVTLNATANAFTTAYTTDQANVTAVAHARIISDDFAKTKINEEVTYNSIGVTAGGATFTNGLAGQTSVANNGSFNIAGDAMIGTGRGQGYAYAEGYWTNFQLNGTDALSFTGNLRTIIAQTNAQLFGVTSETFEKGGTKAFDMDSSHVSRDIYFNNVLSGTVTNHWASYKETKSSEKVNLYDLNFGTALFKEVTTGKVYREIDSGQNIEQFTKHYDTVATFATASATISAKKNAFKIYERNSEFADWETVKIDSTNPTLEKFSQSKHGTSARMFLNFNTFSSKPAQIGFFFDGTETKDGKVWYDDLVTVNSDSYIPSENGYFTITKFKQNWNQYNSIGGPLIDSGEILGSSQFLASTAIQRGLFNLTTTAVLGNTTGSNNNSAGYNTTIVRGIQNTSRSFEEFQTGRANLTLKVELTDKSFVQNPSVVFQGTNDTTALSNFKFDLNNWNGFPEIGSSGYGSVYDGVHEDWGNLVEDVDNPVQQFLQWNGENNLQNELNIGSTGEGIITSNYGTTTATALNDLNSSGVNLGFFSASTFTLDALKAEGFGNAGIIKAAATQGSNASTVTATIPFRVLFFDNGGTSGGNLTADGNGLYIYSGAYNVVGGAVTDITTEASKSSAMGGKHTIVTIEGKSAPASLSDINLV